MSRAVGLIGHGSIAQDLVAILLREDPTVQISVLVRPGREDAARQALTGVGLPTRAPITADLGAFLDTRPAIVAECASHAAVAAYGVALLEAGIDMVVASVGALADDALFDRLIGSAAGRAGQLVVPSGAIGGIDIVAAAKLAGLSSVDYTGRKPPGAWAGTPADVIGDLSHLKAPLVIFDGTAREAAIHYPKNANVAATLALAGVGMDQTRVTLIADPTVSENVHEFRIASSAVEASIRLVGKPSARNPKTSQTTALSIARAVLNRDALVVI
jgi:aspartate dehydrogenase